MRNFASKTMEKATKLILATLLVPALLAAQTDSVGVTHELKAVGVRAAGGVKSKLRTENTEMIGLGQLRRAACCNLGEAFTANPSVDVSYSDAATGARQIKLLGLDGTYVQMLTENIPNLRGAAQPYSLGFVPGPWMQSVQVSKGASSVKNGYESITGQINVEFKKPQSDDEVNGNMYFDSQTKLEANADANIHLNDKLSASLLLHFENRQRDHDGNGDGFMDMPKIRQYNLMHRWAYITPEFVSQLSVRGLRDERTSGMSGHSSGMHASPHYGINIKTDRYEGQWKNALMFQDDHNSSVALMMHGSWHDAGYRFGRNLYDVRQLNGYVQLMFETDITSGHSLAAGVSLNHDNYKETVSDNLFKAGSPSETVYGLYAQYTYKPSNKLTVMPGLRLDRSDVYGTFVTPRLHVKYSPWSQLTLRASAGKGYRSPHVLAENVTLLASGRSFYADSKLKQERAWNCGTSASYTTKVAGRTLELNAEYYYTHFVQQTVADIDGAKGPHSVYFANLDGRSYRHTFQIDATYSFSHGFSATSAFRYNDARTTYNGVLRRRPLTSLYKGLLTLSYKTPMKIWQFDVTGHLNGKGRRYDNTSLPAYFLLQAQVTREFRRWTVYAGGENLTGYRMKNPILNASDPWSPSFDATQMWGPAERGMYYVGVRFKFDRQ